MSRSSRQVALVTGASSGIGQALATVLAQNGYRVYATARQADRIDTTHDVKPIRLDIRDEQQIQQATQAVLAAEGRIDVLINNAGVGGSGALEEASGQEFQDVFRTNVFGLVAITQGVLPGMRERRAGTIVNIGSIGGFLPMPFQAAYGASKAAVLSLTESLRYEVEPFGVRVLLIEPGFVRTLFDQNATAPQQPLAAYDAMRSRALAVAKDGVEGGPPPTQVAEAVLRALNSKSPEWRYKVGKDARKLTLLRALLPDRLFAKGVRQRLCEL